MSTPLPQIKLELRSISKSLFSDSKLLAKVRESKNLPSPLSHLIPSHSPQHMHTAQPSSSDVYSTVSLYHADKKDKESVVAKLKISTIVERPTSMKKCG